MPNTSATTVSISPSVITKYRALFLVLAAELGWTHSQVATHVDTYTKGKGAQVEVITLSWGPTSLKEYTHTKGKTLEAHIQGTMGSKLQRAQTSMGKPMELGAKWNLSKAKLAELEALGVATFKVMEPKG